MKFRFFLLAVIALLMATLACALPVFPVEETAPTAEIIVVTATQAEPAIPTEIPEAEVPTEAPTKAPTEAPTEPTTEAPTQEPSSVPFSCEPGMVVASAFGVEFCYPGQYSNGYSQTMIAANPPSGDTPLWGVNPDYIEIILTGYPVVNEYYDPTIRIYPVDDFIALEPNIQTLVTELQALLASGVANPPSIPFVPIFNAAQMMQAQVAYLDFRNGTGVRLITQYSQAAIPISNDSAFYAFVGLTDDGLYLISATMPINHPAFYPDMMTEPPEGWAAFSDNFEIYLNTMEADLLTQPPEAFIPALSPLDTMMASFLIPPGAIP